VAVDFADYLIIILCLLPGFYERHYIFNFAVRYQCSLYSHRLRPYQQDKTAYPLCPAAFQHRPCPVWFLNRPGMIPQKDILEGIFAFITPVMTLTDGLCVASTKMHACSPCHLGQSADAVLNIVGSNHHKVRQLVNYYHYLWKDFRRLLFPSNDYIL